MKFRNFLLKSFILSLFALSFVACSDDDDPNYWIPPIDSSKGAYILNQGIMGHNNSTLSYYDKETKECHADIFESANDGLFLGDTGQDILITDSKMYISVTGSGYIYVTDLQAKVIKKIESKKDGQLLSPRSFTTYGNYVYVTYFDGYLARIDKRTLEIDKQIKVGDNPEGVKISNGKLYVANSGGLNYPNNEKTVSVIDLNSFTFIKDIEVLLNPTIIESDRFGDLYVVSIGNYGTIKNTVQKINTSDDTVEVIANGTLIRMNPDGDKLYIIYSQYGASEITYKVYDVRQKKMLDGSFLDSSVTFTSNPYSLNFDPATDNIYIGVSDYVSESTMYIISPTTGKVTDQFKTGGISVSGAYFVK